MGSDRYGYWFPLALLGFLLLGLLGLDSLREPADVGWFAYTPQAGTRFLSVEQHSVTLFAESRRYVDYLPMSDGPWAYPPRDWPWPAIVILTFLATVAWYGWRARRAGASSGRPFMWLALGGGVALALAYVVAAWAAAVPNPSEVVTTLGLPLAVLGVVAGAWAYFRLGPGGVRRR